MSDANDDVMESYWREQDAIEARRTPEEQALRGALMDAICEASGRHGDTEDDVFDAIVAKFDFKLKEGFQP